MMASIIVWVQAIGWTPMPSGILRLALLITVLTVVCALAAIGSFLEISAAILSGAYIVIIALAYPVALRGLTMARHGRGEQWFALRRTTSRSRQYVRKPFSSPAAAQLWYEWRRNALFITCFLVFITAMLVLIPATTLRGRSMELHLPPQDGLTSQDYAGLLMNTPIVAFGMSAAAVILM